MNNPGMSHMLQQYLITFGWAITGAVSMAFALSILLAIFSRVTPINEWEEIRKGNMGVALILASVILGTAVVISYAIS